MLKCIFGLHGGGLLEGQGVKEFFDRAFHLQPQVSRLAVSAHARKDPAIAQKITELVADTPYLEKLSICPSDIGEAERVLRDADGALFLGGSEELLRERLRTLLIDEIWLSSMSLILGVSAGANVWSTRFYSNDRARIEDGLEVLPVFTVCHHHDEIDEVLKEQRLDRERYIPLKEGESVFIDLHGRNVN